jgi:hypothetical protein
MQEPDTWHIGVVVGSGVAFKGNRAEAQDHMEAFFNHLRTILAEKGLACVRKDYTIRLKGDPIVDTDDIDATQNGNGVAA